MNIKILISLSLLLFIAMSSCTTVEQGGTPIVDVTQKFLGTWIVNDQPARLNYIVEIKKRPGYDDYVILENFADMGTPVYGLVVTNTIVIDKQSLGEPYKTEGTGSYVKTDKLEFEFMLDDGIDLEARVAAFTK